MSNNGTTIFGPNGEQYKVRPPSTNIMVQNLFEEAQIGVQAYRDANNFLLVPPYASRREDYFIQQLLQGSLSTVGLAPVVDGQFSALVALLQEMAANWQVFVTGKEFPVGKMLDVLAMANDGQGAAHFNNALVGAYSTVNAGFFFSQLPLEIPYNHWESYGLFTRPLPQEKGKQPNNRQLYLSLDDSDMKANKGLWALDPFMCDPTGDPNWPFWYWACDDDGTGRWVLIPSEVGGQELRLLGPKRYKQRIGNCPAWQYLETLIMNTAIKEHDIERMINRPPEGFVWGVGLDAPNQLFEAMEINERNKQEGGSLFFPGRIIGGSISSNADILIKPWTEAPEGYDPEKWRVYKEDVLCGTFHVSTAFLVTRIGTGAFSQTSTTAEISERTGLQFLADKIESIYAKVSPARTYISVVVPSDAAKKRKLDVMETFSRAIKALQESGANLTTEQIQTMTTHETGVNIPDVDSEDETREGDKETSDDQEQTIQLPEWVIYAVGNVVEVPSYRNATAIIEEEGEDTVTVQFGWGKHETLPKSDVVVVRLRQ